MGRAVRPKGQGWLRKIHTAKRVNWANSFMAVVMASPLTSYSGLSAKCYRNVTKPFSAYLPALPRTTPSTDIGYAGRIDGPSKGRVSFAVLI